MSFLKQSPGNPSLGAMSIVPGRQASPDRSTGKSSPKTIIEDDVPGDALTGMREKFITLLEEDDRLYITQQHHEIRQELLRRHSDESTREIIHNMVDKLVELVSEVVVPKGEPTGGSGVPFMESPTCLNRERGDAGHQDQHPGKGVVVQSPGAGKIG